MKRSAKGSEKFNAGVIFNLHSVNGEWEWGFVFCVKFCEKRKEVSNQKTLLKPIKEHSFQLAAYKKILSLSYFALLYTTSFVFQIPWYDMIIIQYYVVIPGVQEVVYA